MAKITGKPTIELSLTFTINEKEARALDALVGYGDDAFIKAFKDNLGKAYIDGNEEGLREFFTSIRSMMPNYLNKINNARGIFNK